MATPDEVKAVGEQQVGVSDFVARLADRIGAGVRASAIFGEPVERDGITVIPVARASWGFGGGIGGETDREDGGGGGGGGFVSPLGYIEVRESGAVFRPIRDPRLVAIVLGTALGVAGLVAVAVSRR
ncbi:MAG: hypothetical protein M9938_01775 [Solirubrobacterales bacterium]|nr:hypothetical protein [Solirubrobacterales bacterium]